MSGFVDECRREWRRLRVPDPVADEMAAELEIDLAEGHAEGVPLEAVLGRSAADPRSFAGAWAAERGVTRPRNGMRRAVIAGPVAAFLAVAIGGAVLMSIGSAPTSSSRQTLVNPRGQLTGNPVWVTQRTGNQVTIELPRFAPQQRASTDWRTTGLVLLLVGFAGVALMTALWLWARQAAEPVL